MALGWLCYAMLDNIDVRAANDDGSIQIEALMQISMFLYVYDGKLKINLATEI